MTTRKIQYVPAALLAALFCAACGASKPSTELVNARNAYTRARTGEAAQLNPAGVHDAYKALQAAEAAHADDAGSEVEKHYAYIATRRSELAVSRASQELARREQQRADQTYRTALEQQSQQSSQYAQQLDQTQSELQQNTQTLDEQRRKLEEARQAAERARSELEQMQAMREEAGRMVINLSGVLFETGGTNLSPLARQRLDTVAQALSAYPGREILIEGHTDSVGSEETNRELSLQRAAAVRDYLTARGVPEDRLHVYGKGEAEPIASNDTPTGRANNRRVEIVIEREGVALGDRQRVPTAGQDPERERQNTSGRETDSPQRTPPAPSGDEQQRSPTAPGESETQSPGQGRGQEGGTTPAQPQPSPSPDE